jgi:hypothetical protein
MKKLGILLLLTTVLAAFSFAQVSVTGGFELENLTGGKKYDADTKVVEDAEMDPAIWTQFYGSASRELGPGSIGAELGLAAKLHFSDKIAAYEDHLGDTYLKGFYALPAGPGELAIGISTWAGFGALSFGLDYDGIAAGPVSLGFGLGYDFITAGTKEGDTAGTYKPAVFGDDPEELDKFTARLSADFDFGLGLVYKFKYSLGEDSDIHTIVYLDLSFQVMDPLTVGVEIDDTGSEFKGFTAKPYVNYAITENTSAGFAFVINNINAESEHGDIRFTPQLTITHSF